MKEPAAAPGAPASPSPSVAARSGWSRALDGGSLVLLLTLVLVLLRFSGPWPLRIAVTALAVSGLVRPRWQSSSWLWLAFAALLGVRLVVDWPLPDNHVYLLAYWCLALGLTRFAERPDEACAQAARLLIAGCFGFAVLWKAWLSPDFVDGTFFRVTLQLDHDPEGLVEKAGDALGIVQSRVKGDLARFKEYIENRGAAQGGWRGDVQRPPVGVGKDGHGAQAHASCRPDDPAGDLAAIGDEHGLQHGHILNMPKRVSGIGALSAAERLKATTLRVSAGSMMPSSHSRAEA